MDLSTPYLPDLGNLALAGIGAITTLVFKQKRVIMGIIPSVVIREQHTDTLQITSHPVQYGAVISDHAYMQPQELVMEVGWTNSHASRKWRLGEFGGSVLGGEVNAVYQALLALQSSRIPSFISTGKRMYANMLVKSLTTTTDADTENALIVTCTFRQVNIVSTETVQLDPDVQANSAKTGGTSAGGEPQCSPDNSAATNAALQDPNAGTGTITSSQAPVLNGQKIN